MFDNKPMFDIAMATVMSPLVPLLILGVVDFIKPRDWQPKAKFWIPFCTLTPLLTFIVTFATLTSRTQTSEAVIYRNGLNAKVTIRYFQYNDKDNKNHYYTISSDKPLDRPKEKAEFEIKPKFFPHEDTTVTITKGNTSTSRKMNNVYLHGVDSATEIKHITIVTKTETIYFRGKPTVTGVEKSAHVTLKDNSKEKDKLDDLFEPSKSRKD